MQAKKGAIWERDCAKMLSLWATDNLRDDFIWRTSGSGSRHTVRQKQGKQTANQAGDLCGTDSSVQYLFDYFLIECKTGYTKGKPNERLDVLYLIDRPKNSNDALLLRWWLKAEKERLESGKKQTLLLFKRTGKRPCVILDRLLLYHLEQYAGDYPDVIINLELGNEIEICICELSIFLDWCDPQIINLLMLQD